MNLKKFTCKIAASFLIFGGAMAFLPAENISFVPTVYAAEDSTNESLIEMYTEEIQKNPKDVQAYFMRGLIYSGYKDEKAVEDFTKVIQFEPNKTRGYLHRGIAYRNAGQYDKSIQDFDKVISMEPNNALNYMNRAMAYYLAKNYDKTRADCNMILKIDTKADPEINKLLSKQGIKLDLNPHCSAQAYYFLGLIDYEQKNYQSAIEYFNKAIQDKEFFMFYAARSKCYQSLGDNKNANADLKKAKELEKKEQAKVDAFTDSVMKKIEFDVDVEEYEE